MDKGKTDKHLAEEFVIETYKILDIQEKRLQFDHVVLFGKQLAFDCYFINRIFG